MFVKRRSGDAGFDKNSIDSDRMKALPSKQVGCNLEELFFSWPLMPQVKLGSCNGLC